MNKAPSWRPVRRGLTYCSPACGYGCTVAQHEKAVSSAAKLCQTLGEGWKPRVWENLGWHYQATSPCERMVVYPVIDRSRAGKPERILSYHADLGGIQCQNSPGQWLGHGKTPREAARDAIQKFTNQIEAFGLFLKEPIRIAGEKPTLRRP